MDEELIGQPVWFPIDWERGTIDSVLHGSDGSMIAVIVLRENGELISIDMQVVKQ